MDWLTLFTHAVEIGLGLGNVCANGHVYHERRGLAAFIDDLLSDI